MSWNLGWLPESGGILRIYRPLCRCTHPRTGAVCQKDKWHDSRVHIGTDVHGKTVMWEERR